MEILQRALFLYFSFLLCCAFYSEGVSLDQPDRFTIFLKNTVLNYTTWLKENNLDPSPPISKRPTFNINNNILKLDGEITNYYFGGISRNLTESWKDSIEGNLKRGELSARFYLLDNITFGGDYIAKGTALNYLSLNGNGTWRIIYSSLYQGLTYRFVITPEGFVNITGPADYLDPQRPGKFVALEFDGLMDDQAAQVKENFQEEILDRFGTFVRNRGIDAVQQSFAKYLKEIYSRTHMSEIMGTSSSPPTTTTTERSQGRSAQSKQAANICNESEEMILDESTVQILSKHLDLKGVGNGTWSLKYYHDKP